MQINIVNCVKNYSFKIVVLIFIMLFCEIAKLLPKFDVKEDIKQYIRKGYRFLLQKEISNKNIPVLTFSIPVSFLYGKLSVILNVFYIK